MHHQIARHLFGAYAPEHMHDLALRSELFSRAFEIVSKLVHEHGLPLVHDYDTRKAEMVDLLSKGETPSWLVYDAELLPYMEFSPVDVHSVIGKWNDKRIRNCWNAVLSLSAEYPNAWPINRLACVGIGIFVIPGYVAFQEMYNG